MKEIYFMMAQREKKYNCLSFQIKQIFSNRTLIELLMKIVYQTFLYCAKFTITSFYTINITNKTNFLEISFENAF